MSGTYTYTYTHKSHTKNTTQHTPEEWSEAIEDIYDKLKSGKATKGEVFRLLTSLQKSHDDLAVEKKRPPIPPPVQNRNDESALDEKSSKALSVSEFLKKSAALGEIEFEAESGREERRDEKKKKNRTTYDEHTYRPQIKELPKSYGSNRAYESVEFNKRVNDWKAKKAKQIQKKKEERVMNKLENCTFQPTINEKSRDATEFRGQNYMSISNRLHNAKIHKGVEQRRKELKKKQEEEFKRLYTFKPKLEKSSYASFSRSISSRGSGKLSLKASRAMKQAKSDAMKDCT